MKQNVVAQFIGQLCLMNQVTTKAVAIGLPFGFYPACHCLSH